MYKCRLMMTTEHEYKKASSFWQGWSSGGGGGGEDILGPVSRRTMQPSASNYSYASPSPSGKGDAGLID